MTNSEESELAKSEGNANEIASPIQTIGTLKRVIQGLYSFGKPSNRNELADALGMDASEVGKTFSDAKDLGLVQKTKQKGIYSLTDSGTMFAQLLGYEKENEARTLIANQILQSDAWVDIIRFIQEDESKPRPISDLVLYVERKIGRKWESGRRKKAERAYRTILSYARIIEVDGDNIVSSLRNNKQVPISLESFKDTKLEKSETLSPIHDMRMMESSDYATFSATGFYALSVRKHENAVRFLQKQLADGVIDLWLENVILQLANFEN